MKKKINSDFTIKLDFERKVENPSRLFKYFSKMIDGISNIDHLFAESINTKIKSKIILDDIEKGSIIAKMWNELVISEDDKLDDVTDDNNISEYLVEARTESLKFIAENKSSVEDLIKLNEKVVEYAKNNELDETFNYAGSSPKFCVKTEPVRLPV